MQYLGTPWGYTTCGCSFWRFSSSQHYKNTFWPPVCGCRSFSLHMSAASTKWLNILKDKINIFIDYCHSRLMMPFIKGLMPSFCRSCLSKFSIIFSRSDALYIVVFNYRSIWLVTYFIWYYCLFATSLLSNASKYFNILTCNNIISKIIAVYLLPD